MVYTKQSWVNSPNTTTPISADRLNHLEDGVYDVSITADGAVQSTRIGALNGVAGLDSSGKVPLSQLLDRVLTTNGNRPVGKGEIFINVTDAIGSTPGALAAGFDSSGLPVWDAALTSRNDAAFAAATALVLANRGGTIFIPAGWYPINRWRIEGTGTVDITIDAKEARLWIAQGSGTTGNAALHTPGFYVGNPTGSPDGADFIRQVAVKGLGIISQLATEERAQRTQVVNRRGTKFEKCQNVYVDEMYIAGFNHNGMLWDTVYDSDFRNVEIFRCSRTARTDAASTAPEPTNRYAFEMTSSIGDNCNANILYKLKIHSCPMGLKMDLPSTPAAGATGHRHNTFLGFKYEHREANSSELNPMYFGWAGENDFHGGLITMNVLSAGSGQAVMHHIGSSTVNWSRNWARKKITFHGTHFATPTLSTGLWFKGSNVEFHGCDFYRSTGLTTGQYAFELGDDAGLYRSGVVMGDQILPSTTTLVAAYNLVKFNGSRSTFEARLDCDGAVSGTMIGVGAPVTIDGTVHPVLANDFKVDIVNGRPSADVAYDVGGTTNLGTAVRIAPGASMASSSPTVSAPTINAFLRDVINISGTYTGMVNGCHGQQVTLIATGATTLTDSTSFRMLTRTDKTMASGQTATFRFLAGFWAEI